MKKLATAIAVAIALLFTQSCKLAEQQRLAHKEMKLEKAEAVEYPMAKVDSDILEPPAYSYRTVEGRSHTLYVKTQDGTVIKGTIEALFSGGSYGRSQGYDICLDRSLVRTLKAGENTVMYIQSPDGVKALRLTLTLEPR
jgi:hypothetical protein